MTVTLPKGGNLLLADEAPGVERVRVGLGWTLGAGAGGIELDGLVGVVTEAAGGGAAATRFALTHQVPNPDEGLGAAPARGPVVGDAERVVVTLAAVPGDVTRLVFGLAIYDAAARRQSFRSVASAYVRLVNDDNGIEIARFTLERGEGPETAMMLGELYRNPRGWKFRAVGQGYERGLRAVAAGAAGSGGAAELLAVPPTQLAAYVRRSSAARSRRTLAEHLDPPKQAAAPKPAEAPKPASRGVSLSHPGDTPTVTTPTVRTPTVTQPTVQPAAGGSLLDLSGAAEQPQKTITYSEHSSRYRQRQESVSVLDNDHPATTWTEQQRGTGRMTITLRWEPLKTSRGLPRPSDVQLGCLWQAGDRATGLLQAVGGELRAPGTAGPRQVLALGRRDELEGQTIFVDLAALPSFRRFFVHIFGQHGSPEWELLRPTLSVQAPSGESLTLRPGDIPSDARLDVIASFHIVQGDLVIRRENAFTEPTIAQAGARFGWELDWAPDGMGLRQPG